MQCGTAFPPLRSECAVTSGVRLPSPIWSMIGSPEGAV